MQYTDQSSADSDMAQLAAVAVAMSKLAEQGAFSGAALVAREGRPLLSRGYGWANLEQATRNTPQTKFQIASISKQFTALAILVLQEQGRLDLHQPLNALVPADMPAWQDVTLHHLLTHTSGIPDLPFWPTYIDPTRNGPITPAYLRELFGGMRLISAPGATFAYSNWGYILLGYVIEQISELPYAEFLQRWIFAPAGMTGSGYADRTRVLPGRAASYAIERGELVNASFLDLEDAYAAGGLYSTVEDLLRWDRALSSETLVTVASLAAMVTPHVAVGDGSSYGYGWQIGARFGRRVQFHGGRIDGFRVQLAR
ncbi:MAG: beta-lactamase family protein, partial [Chloroflexi bacterium]|nr:beta-lactamase family protein [Chloroflexota bacterium]